MRYATQLGISLSFILFSFLMGIGFFFHDILTGFILIGLGSIHLAVLFWLNSENIDRILQHWGMKVKQ